jgi:hypothetical protein
VVARQVWRWVLTRMTTTALMVKVFIDPAAGGVVAAGTCG